MNASAIFQFYINCFLQELLNEFVIIYLNDIFIYSESEKNHQKHVEQVLHQLRESELFIKLEKCIFHVSQVKYLRFIISSQGISMNLTWVNTVKSWLTLCSVKDVQLLLLLLLLLFYHLLCWSTLRAYAENVCLFAVEQRNSLRKKPATSSTSTCIMTVLILWILTKCISHLFLLLTDRLRWV